MRHPVNELGVLLRAAERRHWRVERASKYDKIYCACGRRATSRRRIRTTRDTVASWSGRRAGVTAMIYYPVFDLGFLGDASPVGVYLDRLFDELMTKVGDPDLAVNLRTRRAGLTFAGDADSPDRAYTHGGEIVWGVVNTLGGARLWEVREVVEAGA